MERKPGDRWFWRHVELERRHLDTHRSRSCTEGKPRIDDWMVHDGRFQRVQTRRMHMAA